jgi:UDP-glucose 4-epimerase
VLQLVFMSRVAIITGGTGFLGSHLAARLVDDGWKTYITTRQSAASSHSGVERIVCDLADMDQAANAIESVKPDVVFHLAGSVSARPDASLAREIFRSHVLSAHNLLDIALRNAFRRLVLCGSMMEMTNEVPSSPYAAAKGVVRVYGEMFHSLWASPVVVVRPYMTFGPRQSTEKVLPYVIQSLQNGESPRLESGHWSADWIYVDDVIDGFVKAAMTPEIEGAVLDLGRGELHSLRDMVGKIVSQMGTDVPVIFGARADRPNVPVRTADVSKTLSTLNWSPNVSLEEGLARTIASYVGERSE